MTLEQVRWIFGYKIVVMLTLLIDLFQGRAAGVTVLMDLLDGSRQFLVAAEERYITISFLEYFCVICCLSAEFLIVQVQD